MATYPPPNFIEPLDEFNTSNWITNATAVGFTPAQIAYLNAKYLKFPVAQGLETLQAIIVNGVASFNNTALPTSLGTLPAPNTISTQIPTMDWVQQAITAGGSTILSNNNTFTGTNDFTNNVVVSSNNFTYTGTLQAGTSSSNNIATNQFVQSAITASQQQNNNYGGLQETLIYSEIPYNYSRIDTIGGQTLYTYGVSSVSFAVSKSFNTTAYSTTNGVYFNFNSSNPITSIGQNTLKSFSPAPQSSFEPCVLAFSADGQYAIATSDSFATNPSEVYLMNKTTQGSGTINFDAVSGLYEFFNDACLSADGQYQLLAEISGSSKMYSSSNYGSTFTQVGSVGVWWACAMSATGKYQMGVSQYDAISNSSDFGATWINTSFGSNSFNDCCMSATGQYQIAICNGGGSPDSMMMSYDSGATWEVIDNLVGGIQLWVNVGITDCGRVAYAYENTGGVYYTLDYGKTWTNTTPSTFLNGVSHLTFSVNGKYLIGQKSGSVPQYVEFAPIF